MPLIKRLQPPVRWYLATLSAALTLLLSTADAAPKSARRYPKARIVALNYHEGINEVTPSTNFSLEATIRTSSDYPDSMRFQLPVAFYLVSPSDLDDLSEETISAKGLYFGKGYFRSPRKGETTSTLTFFAPDELRQHEGQYTLVAWIDPAGKRTAKSKKRIFVSGMNVTLSNARYNHPSLSIVSAALDQQALIADQSSERILGGQLTIQSSFTNVNEVAISACLVMPDSSCTPLPIWDPASLSFSSNFKLAGLERDDQLTTLFQVKLPPLQPNESLRIRFNAVDQNNSAGSAERDVPFGALKFASENLFQDTDFARDIRRRMDIVRATIKRERLKGKIPNPVLPIKRSKNGIVDLAKTLEAITAGKRAIVAKTFVEADSSPLDGLQSSLPGSRFNMPDQDFPWLKGIDVKADPPPEQYQGTGFPTIAEYRRCIPFFCGPNSPSEAGQDPSDSCIRRFCGTLLEDIHYGGRNPNLLDEQAGFDKSFSAGGFGARMGVSGQAKVYHDKAISDYVAASYETNAFFGVKVFSYSVPIFEMDSQSVYSPTELGESMSRNVFKILGRVIEKKEGASDGLSLILSETYGFKESAEVGIGPFNVDVEVEAGGTGGLELAIGQIDILRGIVASLTPFARIGASARATTDVVVGRFGVEGSLTLLEDRIPVTATFNAGLDLARKVVRPQLNLNIVNNLIGPNGYIDLILVVSAVVHDITYSTRLASFSTGTFSTTIYNKDTVFAEIGYN